MWFSGGLALCAIPLLASTAVAAGTSPSLTMTAVAGTVRLWDGTGVPRGAYVVLDGKSVAAVSDAGVFEFETPRREAGVVTVVVPARGTGSRPGDLPFSNWSTRVDLTADRNLSLSLPRPVSITFVGVDMQDKPLPYLAVFIYKGDTLNPKHGPVTQDGYTWDGIQEWGSPVTFTFSPALISTSGTVQAQWFPTPQMERITYKAYRDSPNYSMAGPAASSDSTVKICAPLDPGPDDRAPSGCANFPPPAPNSLSTTSTANGVSVSWLMPDDVKTAGMTGYSAQALPSRKTCTSEVTLNCEITGLPAGTRQIITVTAINRTGRTPSVETVEVVVPALTPGPVRNLRAKSLRGSISVVWAPPEGTVNLEGLNYQYRVATGPWTSTVTRRVLIPGKPRKPIMVEVRAVTEAGPGPAAKVAAAPK